MSGVGARVRAWRARRGATRRQLALDSGLSERFLADVEAGKGNVSVHSLDAVARALGIGLVDLLQDAAPPAVAGIHNLLARLTEPELDAAHALLLQHFGRPALPGRDQRIALLGLRGAGKSTLGALLAARRGVPFVELDREIEREAGTGVNDILLLHGQAGYRQVEHRALQRIAAQHAGGVVMTTGGSIVSEAVTFDDLQAAFWCVWLQTSPAEHMARVVAQGDLRPFEAVDVPAASTAALDDIRRILASRAPLYARADAVVNTAGRTVRQSLADLGRAVPRLKTLESA